MGSIDRTVTVECTECRYSVEVTRDGEKLPADYVIEHGEETGHTLSIGADDD